MKRLNFNEAENLVNGCAAAVKKWMLAQGAMDNGYESRLNFQLCSVRPVEVEEIQFPKDESAWAHLTYAEQEARLKPLLDSFQAALDTLPPIDSVAYQLRVSSSPDRHEGFTFDTTVTLQIVIHDLTLGVVSA